MLKNLSFHILFAILTVYFIFSFKKKLIVPDVFKYFLLLPLIGLITALFSDSILFALLNSFSLFLYISFGLILFNSLTRKELPPLIEMIIYATAFISALGIIQFFWPGFLTDTPNVPGKWKVISTFGNPAYLAAYLAGILPLAWQKYFKDKNITNLIMALLPLLCLTLTFARASWLSLLFILTIWIIVNKKLPYKQILALGLLILILITLIISSQPDFKKHFLNLDSWKGRFFLWQINTQVIKDHWLTGVGLNQFRIHQLSYQQQLLQEDPKLVKIYAPFAPVEEYVHNDFLQVFAELGIFGFLLFLYSLYLIFRKFKKLAKDPASLEFAALLGLAALAINALFFFPFYLPATLLLAIFLVTILCYSDKSSLNLSIGITAQLLTTLAAIIIIFISLSTFLGDIYLEKGSQALQAGRPQISLRYLKKAVSLNRWSGENRYFLAKAYYFNEQYALALPQIKQGLTSFRNYYIYTLQAFLYNKLQFKKQAKELFWLLRTALPGQKLNLNYGLALE
ncbi:O-antigen ligase family protein [Candidatus Margulisiibacteriota bacterium]